LKSTSSSNQLKELAKSIKQLQSKVSTLNLSRIETERLNQEILLIEKRLCAREYKKSSFNTNVLNIPDRVKELSDDLVFLTSIGKIWAEIFLLLPNKKYSILDIGPGYFPKIELGLYYNNFRGTVTLLDNNNSALIGADSFLKFFNIKFQTKKFKKDIWSKHSVKYDLIVANHLIDDLLLSQFCTKNKIPIKHLYTKEESFVNAWKQIVYDKKLSAELINRFSAQLNQLTKNSGYIILLDYPSHSHKSLKLHFIFSLVKEFKNNLFSKLKPLGFKAMKLPPKFVLASGNLKLNKSSLLFAHKEI
jgi:hypothetical protein